MRATTLTATQRRMGFGLIGVLFGTLTWAVTPELPPVRLILGIVAARALSTRSFDSVWASLAEKIAPPFSPESCVACHSSAGGLGGGPSYHRAFAIKTSPSGGLPRLETAMIECAQPGAILTEARALPRGARPTTSPSRLVGGVCRGCGPSSAAPHIDSISSPPLFGLGLVDRLRDDAIVPSGRGPRPIPTDGSATVIPGRPRILPDGRVGRFGWKAEFATLADFLTAGCANPPRFDCATPVIIKATGFEFGVSPRHLHDVLECLNDLPRPEAILPESPGESAAARRGEILFAAIGCVACHTPDLGGVRGVYGDFLLHRLDRSEGGATTAATPNSPAAPPMIADPLPDEWRTAPLWGVADSAPYLHDGSAPTFEVAIARHHGDAEPIYQAYNRLDAAESGDLIAFLGALKGPAESSAAPLVTIKWNHPNGIANPSSTK